jgi:hypothetical protein
MTYAESLERELIQVTKERDRMLAAIVSMVENKRGCFDDSDLNTVYLIEASDFYELETIATVSP